MSTKKRTQAESVPNHLKEVVLTKIQESCGLCPECDSMWNWMGNNKKKMPKASVEIDKLRYPVRRNLYQLVKGRRVPDSYVVATTCDCPTCINPELLKAVSRGQLLSDLEDKGKIWNQQHKVAVKIARRMRGDCKLSEGAASKIRMSGIATKELAEEYKVSHEAINMVKRGCIWTTSVGGMFAQLMR